jgi:hypothetical protein
VNVSASSFVEKTASTPYPFSLLVTTNTVLDVSIFFFIFPLPFAVTRFFGHVIEAEAMAANW